MLDTPEETLQLLVDTHFPGNTTDLPPAPPSFVQRCRLDDEGALFISPASVKSAIKGFGSFKAPGPDGLPPCVYKHLGDQAIERLTAIYKASFLLGYTPKSWRNAKVIFLPKPGKDDYTVPRSFRPITLSNVMLKIMERVVQRDLEETCFRQEPLHTDQHTFRVGRGTDTALSRLVDTVEGAMSKKEYALGVFLDIQGAFDNVIPSRVLDGLASRGVPPPYIRWYQHYLLGRSMSTEHRGVSVQRRLTLGTPQGGVLSPLMWNVCFDSLLHAYDHGPVRCIGFADDGALLTTGPCLKLLYIRMQEAIDTALEWGRQQGLSFSPPKTVAVLFTRRTAPVPPRRLWMGNVEIQLSDQVKYLGLLLDRQLTWSSHINWKIKQAKGLLLKIANSMGKVWGLSPKWMRWAYTGIVRPALTYGALVWARGCLVRSQRPDEPHPVRMKATLQKKFERVNRLALLQLGHFRRSTPTGGLEVISYVMPLDLYIIETALMALLRTRGTKDWWEWIQKNPPPARGYQDVYLTLLTSMSLDQLPIDKVPDTPMVTSDYQVLEDYDDENAYYGPNSGADSMTIYTDGAANLYAAGSALIVYDGCTMVRGCPYTLHPTTAFFAELFAVKKAAEYLQQVLSPKSVTIFTDSRKVLQTLAGRWSTSELAHQTSRLLTEAGARHTISLRWVPAHKGHQGNELADQAASQAACLAPAAQDQPKLPWFQVQLEVARENGRPLERPLGGASRLPPDEALVSGH